MVNSIWLMSTSKTMFITETAMVYSYKVKYGKKLFVTEFFDRKYSLVTHNSSKRRDAMIMFYEYAIKTVMQHER